MVKKEFFLIKKVHFIFSHSGLGSPLFIPLGFIPLGAVRGELWKKRKNEMPPIKMTLPE